MALVTSQSTLPDFEYEHHTVILDNLDPTVQIIQILHFFYQHHWKILFRYNYSPRVLIQRVMPRGVYTLV